MHSSKFVIAVVVVLFLFTPVELIGDIPIPVTMGLVLATTEDDIPIPVADIGVREDLRNLWTNMSIHFYNNVSCINEHALSFLWDFGDDSALANVPDPVHVYKEPGLYTVTMNVHDDRSGGDSDTIFLWINDNYGDTEIIIKAIGMPYSKPYRDPHIDLMNNVSVQRGGWVAYLCEFKEGLRIDVRVTIIGDRPADVFLFQEEEFQTYMNVQDVPFVRYEVKGSRPGVTGEFYYEYKPDREGRYYIVIDNRDWPKGTDTIGPVDYTISIEPVFEREPPETDWVEVITWPLVLWLVLPVTAIGTIRLLLGGKKRR